MKSDNSNPHVTTAEFILEGELYGLIVFTKFTRLYKNLQQ